MDEAMLFEGVLRGVLGGRRKRGRRASRYLTGRALARRCSRTRPALLAAAEPGLGHLEMLLTAAGVAWGLDRDDARTGLSQAGRATACRRAAAVVADAAAAGDGRVAPAAPMQSDALADGAAGDFGRAGRRRAWATQERAEVQRAASEHGHGRRRSAAELAAAAPLAAIVAGVTDPAQRATLYGLAFAVVRADEQVSGAERIYLAQLAHLLGLDPAAVQKLEATAAAKIDAGRPSRLGAGR